MLFFAIILLLSSFVCASSDKSLYLDLMKKCLINSIYQDSCSYWYHSDNVSYQKEVREKGLDWPNVAHTMIGLHRLNNLQFCVEDVLQNNISGDFIETGVWRGGSTIFMRAILKAYNNTERKVFVADSFEGLPPSNPALYPADAGYDLTHFDTLSVSLPQVQSNFARYDLLDDQVVFLKGWFKDTLPTAPIERLAILRLDGDLYESTMDALVSLYPKLSVGGYIIVDDYGVAACCAQAINDFRELHNITDTLHPTADGIAVFWKKTQ